ncbi:MAG: hypothetical protein OXU46_01400 [Candidatus Marinimicrobia bacterium]|nr:hypothetical protein [Candidatus Neomarinimicrobiota bacterium]
MKRLNPKNFNIKSKIYIEDRGDNICIIINRKSRIIMKDGERILGYVKAIQGALRKPISIETGAPVCSKTKAYLQTQSVLIKSTHQKKTNTK